MQEYMVLFGSGINFYGGPGESARKQLMKVPGHRTHQRVSEFTQQIALQYYNMLVSGYAAHDCTIVPIFTNNEGILTQILTLTNQKETLSLKCQESMILKLLVK